MATFARWYIAECPLAVECSKASWDRCTKCTSWKSADECKEKLRQHLQRSSHHSHNSEEVVQNALDIAIVETEEVPAHWFQEEKNKEEEEIERRQQKQQRPIGAPAEQPLPPPKRQRVIGSAEPDSSSVDSMAQATIG